MRRLANLLTPLLVAAAVLSAASTAVADAPASPQISPQVRAQIAALGNQLGVDFGYALAPLASSQVERGGRLVSVRAWSTIKVPISAGFLEQRRLERGATSGYAVSTKTERGWVDKAIRYSDNTTPYLLFMRSLQTGGREGAIASIDNLFRKAGDPRTKLNVAADVSQGIDSGFTRWRLADSARFYRALATGCLLTLRDTSYLLQMMRTIVYSKWGVVAAGYPLGTNVAYKVGLSEPERVKGGKRVLAQQAAVIGGLPDGYALTFAALPRTGSGNSETAAVIRAENAATDLVRLIASSLAVPVAGLPVTPACPAKR